MSDECPPFLVVLGYLFALVISAVMFLYLILYLLSNPLAQTSIYVFILAFVVIVAYSKIQLLKMLFPARAGWLTILFWRQNLAIAFLWGVLIRDGWTGIL